MVMEYPFLALDDSAQIAHSEIHANDSVLAHICKDTFSSAALALPMQEWRDAAGFTAGKLAQCNRAIPKGCCVFFW